MKLLFLGDIVGNTGSNAIKNNLSEINNTKTFIYLGRSDKIISTV